MRIHEITESYDIEGVEHELPDPIYPLPEGFGKNFIDYLIHYKVSSLETAYFDYVGWQDMLDKLHSNGGDIYRAVFVSKGEKIYEPFGEHWSMTPLTNEALFRLWSDCCYNRMDPYEDNDHEMAIIHARTGPKNVTIEGVNLPEEYEEHEVNLINPAAIEVVKITRHPVPKG